MEGGVLNDFKTFATRAKGWTALSYAINEQVPSMDPRDDLDTSLTARDSYKIELANLSKREMNHLLRWGRKKYPAAVESSTSETESQEHETNSKKPVSDLRHSTSEIQMGAKEVAPMESEEDHRVKRMTRTLNKVLYDAQEDFRTKPLNSLMGFAQQYPLRRPKIDKSSRKALLSGFPEVEDVAPPQEWHPVLFHHASDEVSKFMAKEARSATELRSDVMRCLSLALDDLPDSIDGVQSPASYAILAAASLVEIHTHQQIRSARTHLLARAYSGKAMPASKYYSAVFSRDDHEGEYIGDEVSSLSSIEDLQLTGLVKPDDQLQTPKVVFKRAIPAPVREPDQTASQTSSFRGRGCGRGQFHQRRGGTGRKY